MIENKAVASLYKKSLHSCTYQKGWRAEKIATLWLWFKGYKILERRYKTVVGEIDVIAQKGKLIIFVEVKRRSDRQSALESVNRTNQERVSRAASYYISQNPSLQHKTMRFDVMTITPLVLGIVTIHHLDNAWQVSA